jgi:hypothetical protein
VRQRGQELGLAPVCHENRGELLQCF